MLMQVLLEPWKWEPPGSWVTLKRSLSYVIYYMFPMARCLPPCIIHGLWIALKLLSHNWGLLLWDGIFKEFKEVEMWQILLRRLVKMMLMQLYRGVVWKKIMACHESLVLVKFYKSYTWSYWWVQSQTRRYYREVHITWREQTDKKHKIPELHS